MPRGSMTQRQREHWSKLRAFGFWYYVFVFGVMAFGMSMAVTLLAVSESIGLPTRFQSHPIACVAGFCAVGGWLMGLFTWMWAESRYHR